MKNRLLYLLYLTHSLLVVQPVRSACEGRKKLKRQLASSRLEWNQRTCYDYEFLYTSSVTASQEVIQVRNGVVVETSGVFTKTMDDLFDVVQETCIEQCLQCDIVYSPLGYIESLVIDYDPSSTRDEIGYFVSNLKLCEECDNDEKDRELEMAYKKNRKAWGDLECYDIKFIYSSFTSIVIDDLKIRNGKIVNSNDPRMKTMSQVYDMIQQECVDGCSNCRVSYGDKGIIDSLSIDPVKEIDGDEISYMIQDFVSCADLQGCADEAFRDEFERELLFWGSGFDCYNMSVIYTIDSAKEYTERWEVEVRDRAIQNEEPGMVTMNDLFAIAKQQCINTCGSCSISYHNQGGIKTLEYQDDDGVRVFYKVQPVQACFAT